MDSAGLDDSPPLAPERTGITPRPSGITPDRVG